MVLGPQFPKARCKSEYLLLLVRCPGGDVLGDSGKGGVYDVGWAVEFVAQYACVLDACKVVVVD